MKKILTLATAGLLALTVSACSSEPEMTPEEQFLDQLASELPPTPGTQVDPMTTVTVGDVIPMTCYSHLPCDAELLITEVTVGEQCRYGTNDYSDYEEVQEGQQYLQIWGEFSVASADNGWTMVDDPQIIDEEGFTQATGMTVDCRSADDGHQSWSTPVDAGQKSRIYGSWIIPVGAESALLEDHRIELPEPVGDTAAAAAPAEAPDFTPVPSASPAPAPAPAAPVISAPAPVIGFTGAPGHDPIRVLDKTIASCGDPTMHETGTTFFTDGTSGWTQDCANQMGY